MEAELLLLLAFAPASKLEGKTETTDWPNCTWASTEFKWLSVAVIGAKLALGLSKAEEPLLLLMLWMKLLLLLLLIVPLVKGAAATTRRMGAVQAVLASTLVGIAGNSMTTALFAAVGGTSGNAACC